MSVALGFMLTRLYLGASAGITPRGLANTVGVGILYFPEGIVPTPGYHSIPPLCFAFEGAPGENLVLWYLASLKRATPFN